MIILNAQIKHELMKGGRKHPYISPVWMLYYARITQDEKTLVRVTLVKNQAIEAITSMTFSVTRKDAIQKITTTDIRQSAYDPDNPIFNALFECPKGMESGDLDLGLIGLTLEDIHALDFGTYIKGPLRFPSQGEEQLPDFTHFYWQCECLKYNALEHEVCGNCGKTKQHNHDLFETGIDPEIIDSYLNEHPITALPDRVYQRDWMVYKAQLKKDLNISDGLIEKLNLKERVRKDYDAYVARVYGPLRRSSTKSFISLMIFLALMVFMGTYGGPYLVGRSALAKRDYAQAIKVLNPIESFADSEELILEARFRYANDLAFEDPLEAMAQLEAMNLLTNKDAMDLYNAIVYAYGVHIFEEGDYELAAEYFEKIDYRESAVMRDLCYYRLANQAILNDSTYDLAIAYLAMIWDQDYMETEVLVKEWPYQRALKHFEKDETEAAIAILETLGNYKDSILLRNKSAYEQGILRYEQEDYYGAIAYFNKAKEYLDTSDWLLKANYQIGNDYYTQENYPQAYAFLIKASGYKDADTKAKAIEDLMYQWEIKTTFNTSPDSTEGLEFIHITDPVYIHIDLNGGPPGEMRHFRLWYHLPNGDEGEEFYDSIESGETYWLGWEDGLYIDPASGETGLLRVELYDRTNNKLLLQDFVKITE